MIESCAKPFPSVNSPGEEGGKGAMALEQMSSHLKFTKLKAMRCADANKSARAKLGRRQRGFPGWPTPCLVSAGRQRDRQTERLAANDSWLLSPSGSEIRTAEPSAAPQTA